MIELESCPLFIVLFFEKTFESAATLKRLWSASSMCSLPQNCMKIRICMSLLRVTLFHMLMSGEIKSPKMRSHVIELSPGFLAAHSKSVLEWILSDPRIDWMASLNDWLLLNSAVIAACCWSSIIILLSGYTLDNAIWTTWNTCNLWLKVFIKFV